MGVAVDAEILHDDERILQTIDECISSRDHDYETNKQILKEILEDVFTTIKGRNTFFQRIFQDFFFVEKYYKGPEHGKPEEFHVNIIMKIPLDFTYIKIEEGEPGSIMLTFPNNKSIFTSEWHKYKYQYMSKWLVWRIHSAGTNSYDMNKDEFRKSMETLLASNMLNVPRIDNYTIKVHENSGALSLCVTKEGFPEMNVNLMPVIEFSCNAPYSIKDEDLCWYAMPDPSQDVLDHKYQWRLLMYNNENEFLTRHSYVTPAIRQLEKLRDTQKWNVISYYHIKTLAMLYAKSMENDSGLPGIFKLTGTKLFIHMLGKLMNMCKTQYLENFWDPKHNLINTNHSQFADIVKQLTRMIYEITDDPAKVAEWIMTSEELSIYENELKAVGIVRDTDYPSKNLHMSENDGSGSSEDVRKTVDGVSKPFTGPIAVAGNIELSPSNEAGKDIAGCLEELNRVIAGLRDSMDMLSCRLTAIEEKSTATASSNVHEPFVPPLTNFCRDSTFIA